ncbi:MAG: site-2 protease family protein [Solirubrobacteraceae bacterium]
MGRSGSVQLARVFGIRIGADYGWFLILFLAIFFAREQIAGLTAASDTTVYVAAVVEASLFFGSIIAHEMGHALAARREGIAVSGIDLFLFGGLMHMRSEPRTPGAEFRVAAAGPAVTVLLIVVATLVGIALGGVAEFVEAVTLNGRGKLPVATTMVSSVALINAFVLVFNLIPAYPLDGGRIARAAVWKATGDRHRATRAAAAVGQGFGGLLVLGGLLLLLRGHAFDGIYTAILGWLLATQARGVAAQSAVAERLEGVTVADLMDPEPVTIPAATEAVSAYEDFFLRYGYDWFAVTEPDGAYVGRAFREALMHAADGPDAARPVREMTGEDADGRVRDDATLETLLASEPLRRLGALMAVDEAGRLRGVVTAEAVARALRGRLVPG